MAIIYFLVIIIAGLILYSVMQLKVAGINIKDFWSFIGAIKNLDKLYKFSKRYEIMNTMQQVIFLSEAEEMFKAFDKVPSIIWEDEYSKYAQVLDTYKSIRLLRWSNASA